MKNFRWYIILLVLVFAFGCKKDDGGTLLPPSVEDFSFLAKTDTAVTLYSDGSTVSAGQTFDVKLICYNVDSTFGSSFEVFFTKARLQVLDVIVGPFFSPSDQTVQLKKIENDSGRVSFGISYVRNSGRVAFGSGVVCKIRFQAIAVGTAQVSFNQSKVELRKAEGTYITNFSRLQYQNLSVVVQ